MAKIRETKTETKKPERPLVCIGGKEAEIVDVAGSSIAIILDGNRVIVRADAVKAKNKEAAEMLRNK